MREFKMIDRNARHIEVNKFTNEYVTNFNWKLVTSVPYYTPLPQPSWYLVTTIDAFTKHVIRAQYRGHDSN